MGSGKLTKAEDGLNITRDKLYLQTNENIFINKKSTLPRDSKAGINHGITSSMKQRGVSEQRMSKRLPLISKFQD
jgi:hypothetical protein